MKKIRILGFIVLSFMLSLKGVNAECSVDEQVELQRIIANIKANYNIVTESYTLDQLEPGFNPPDGLTEEEIANYVYKKEVIEVLINNLTEKLYVEVSINGEKNTYNYNDTDNGQIIIKQDDNTSINKYTISVYASSNTGCEGNKLTTLYVTTPRYNYLSDYAACDGIEEYYLCSRYVTTEDIGEGEFLTKTADYRASKEKEENEKNVEKEDKGVLKFIKEHVVAISIISIIVIAGVTVAVILVKKQRSRK